MGKKRREGETMGFWAESPRTFVYENFGTKMPTLQVCYSQENHSHASFGNARILKCWKG